MGGRGKAQIEGELLVGWEREGGLWVGKKYLQTKKIYVGRGEGCGWEGKGGREGCGWVGKKKKYIYMWGEGCGWEWKGRESCGWEGKGRVVDGLVCWSLYLFVTVTDI